ncbi:cytochrome P450 [Leucobacter soli]
MQEPGHGCASAMYGLLVEPEQLQRVREDPALVLRAVEEGIRWISPIGHTERQVVEETELGGVRLQPGDAVYLMLSAANRDPAQFADPERFDIDRENRRHIAFGGGMHVCAGNAFGRAIMRVALEELLVAAPDLRLEPGAEIPVTGWHFRSPRRLPVLL